MKKSRGSSEGPSVVIYRDGNRVGLVPPTQKIRDLLEETLTFEFSEFTNRGRGNMVAHSEDVSLFLEQDEMIVTQEGFLKRIRRVLKAAGLKTFLEDYRTPKRAHVYEPQWSRLDLLEDFEFRPRQRELLELMFAKRCGRISAPTGMGKSMLIALMAFLLPKARIDIVVEGVAIMNRIYKDLHSFVPSAGRIGGGHKDLGCRVTLYSADSLHHSDGSADILVGDEIQTLAADRTAEILAFYDHSRNFGFSATHDMRLDQKDPRMEMIFGPIIFKMSYDEAVALGLVNPIEVNWTHVYMEDPCGESIGPYKKRKGLWANAKRNRLVAKRAKAYAPEVQTLLVTAVIEHAVHLKKLLPDYELVHGEMSEKDRDFYIDEGLLNPSEPEVTPERRENMAKDFARGRLKKVICTGVWKAGVDFPKLAVLIRADGEGRPIDDTQIPGRTSRVHKNKPVSKIEDFVDHFSSFEGKSAKRYSSYEDNGWKQTGWDGRRHGGSGW